MGYGKMTQLGIDTVDPVTKKFDYTGPGVVCEEAFHDGNQLRGTLAHSIERVRRNNRKIYTPQPMVMEANAGELALLLPWILGTAAAGNVYALAETRPTRFVCQDEVDKVFTYNGVAVNQARFKGSEGMPLTVELSLIGIDEAVGAAATFPALSLIDTTGPFMFTDSVWTVGGVTYTPKDIDILIDFQIDDGRFFNSQTLTAAYPRDRIITVSTHLPYTAATAAYNSGPGGVAVVGTFTNGTVSIIFDFVKVAFPRRTPPVRAKDEILLPLEGQAYKSGSTLELVTTLDSTV